MRPAIAVFLCVVLLACGCSGGTSNGTSNLNDPIPTAVFAAGGLGLFAGEPAQLTLSISAGTPPYEVAISMGGGADNVPAGTGVDAVSTHDFTLAEGGPYTYIVTVTDDAGRTGSCTGDYGPVGPPQNHAPTVMDIAFTGGMLAVAVDDPDGDDPLTVSVAEVPGLVPSVLTQQVGNKSSALFTYKLVEGFNPAELDVTVTVSDGRLESSASVTAAANTPLVEIPQGTLAAYPLKQVVGLDETATVMVTAGEFPQDAPFAFLNGVGVAFDTGVRLESINIGDIGGERLDNDGIWAKLDPQPVSYFDYDMLPTFIPAELLNGEEWEFVQLSVVPINAGETTQGGNLLNLEVSFEHTGYYDVNFIRFQDVKRTYYSDLAGVEYDWLNLGNRIDGLPRTIRVIEAENAQPQIASAGFDGNRLTVEVSDGNADDELAVSLAAHSALLPDHSRATVTGAGTVAFEFVAYNTVVGAYDPLTITVSDGELTSTTTLTPPAGMPLVAEVPQGTLVAFPLQREVAVGESVTVVAKTGAFPTGSEFKGGFQANITVDAKPEFVGYNIGTLGGKLHDPDGVWATMDPVPTGFFNPMMYWEFFRALEDTDPQLYHCPCWAFSATGGPTTSGGDLFNLTIAFAEPGVYRLGFAVTGDSGPTGYAGITVSELAWDDISYSHPDLPNTITVVE